MDEPTVPSAPARSEEATRRRLLDRLSAPVTKGGAERLLPPSSSAEPPLSSLLDEIDETVMSRRLILEAPDGGTALLDVSNRRLLHVVIHHGSTSRGSLELTARDLTYGGVDPLLALRDGLNSLCNAGTRLVVSAAAAPSSLEHPGVSAAILQDAWRAQPPGREADTRDPDPPEEPVNEVEADGTLWDLCLACAPDLRAWVLYSPDDEATGDGEEALLDPLSQVLAEVEARPLDAGAGDGPSTIMLSTGDAASSVLLVTRNGSSAALVPHVGREAAILTRVWSQIMPTVRQE